MNTHTIISYGLLLLALIITSTIILGRLWANLPLSRRLALLHKWNLVAGSIIGLILLICGFAFLWWTTFIYKTLFYSETLVAILFCMATASVGVPFVGLGIYIYFKLACSSFKDEPEIEKGRTIGDLKGAIRSLSRLGKREQSRVAGHVGPEPSSVQSVTLRNEDPTPRVATRGPKPFLAAANKSADMDSGKGTLTWGMLDLPASERTQHFLVLGAVGSGKSLTIQMLMRSVLSRMRERDHCRVLILDDKREYLSYLAGILPSVKVRTFDPFDVRGVAWDIAADITTSADADQFVHLLIPRGTNESQPYFSDAARDLTKATIEVLQKTSPLQWTLRDVLLLTENPDRLRCFLAKVPAVMDRAQRHFDANEFPSVMSTLATKLGPLTVVAALWEKATPRFSLAQWMAECSILLFANDRVHRESVEPLNRAIFARASNLLLSQNQKSPDQTWVFLDEVRETGKLDGLRSLLNLGRSKGVGVVLGFQDVDGMRAVYGKEEAMEIIGQCNNKTFLRTDSAATAQWMEANAGKVLVKEASLSFDPNSPGMPKSASFGRTVRDAVLASEFMAIPRTISENGLRAFHLNPLIGAAYWTHTPLADVVKLAGEGDPGVPDFIKRPEELQDLVPWSILDASRFGIPFKTPSKSDPNEAQTSQGKAENADTRTESDEPKPSKPVESPKETSPKADPGDSKGSGDALDRLNSVKRRNDEDQRTGPEGA